MELPPLLLVDKPKGMSSFTVIRELRRRTGVRKFGHAGTLDPLATGLMLIGVEKGTKQLTALVGLDKEYVADIRLGESRSTGDLEGVVTTTRAYAGDLTEEGLVSALAGMLGEHHLPVSAYSAIKRDGVPMYKRARRAAKQGELIPTHELPMRKMIVHEAELLSTNLEPDEGCVHAQVRFKVSSGTYIRSLAEEFGRRLGYPATLSNLRRTKIGSYSIAEASQLEDFGPGFFRKGFRRLLSHLRHRLGLGASS